MILVSSYERLIASRYLLPGKGERFIVLVAGFSLGAVMLGVAALVIVMSVMNGFRAELFDKIVGLNGHAVVDAVRASQYGIEQRAIDARADDQLQARLLHGQVGIGGGRCARRPPTRPPSGSG